MIDVDVFPSDTSWLSEATTGVHQFGGGSTRKGEAPPFQEFVYFLPEREAVVDVAGLKRRGSLLALRIQPHCRFPVGRSAGIVAVRRHHLAVEFSRHGDELPLAQLGAGLAVNMLVPRPLEP
jgi:hypothetical protein